MNQSLLDQASSPDQLFLAAQHVIKAWRRRKDYRRKVAYRFVAALPEWIETTSFLIRRGEYPVSGYYGVALPKKRKGEYRPISLSNIGDQIVQRSILDTIWQYVEGQIDSNACYCTFKKDSLQAFQGRNLAGQRIARLRSTGFPFAAKIDILNFYGSIPLQELKKRLAGLLPDDTLLPLICSFMKCTLTNPEISEKYPTLWIEDTGIPQGAVLSPLIACLYLRDFDKYYTTSNKNYFRFVDDILILTQTFDEATTEEQLCVKMLYDDFKLTANPTKREYYTQDQSIPYLGLQIGPTGVIKPSSKAVSRLSNLADSMLANRHILHSRQAVTRVNASYGSWLAAYKICTFSQAELSDLDRMILSSLTRWLKAHKLKTIFGDPFDERVQERNNLKLSRHFQFL